MDVRKCAECGEEKPLSAYMKRSGGGGRRRVCRACMRRRRKQPADRAAGEERGTPDAAGAVTAPGRAPESAAMAVVEAAADSAAAASDDVAAGGGEAAADGGAAGGAGRKRKRRRGRRRGKAAPQAATAIAGEAGDVIGPGADEPADGGAAGAGHKFPALAEEPKGEPAELPAAGEEDAAGAGFAAESDSAPKRKRKRRRRSGRGGRKRADASTAPQETAGEETVLQRLNDGIARDARDERSADAAAVLPPGADKPGAAAVLPPGADKPDTPAAPPDAAGLDAQDIGAAEETADAPKRKRKRKRRRRGKSKAQVLQAEPGRPVRPPDKRIVPIKGPFTYDPSVLNDRGSGMIRLRGRRETGKRWSTEIPTEMAVRMVREGAAGIINPGLIHKLYTKSDFRLLILQRDDYICRYCGRFGDTIDHVMPKSKGGLSSPDNCVCACADCNLKKADSLDFVFDDL